MKSESVKPGSGRAGEVLELAVGPCRGPLAATATAPATADQAVLCDELDFVNVFAGAALDDVDLVPRAELAAVEPTATTAVSWIPRAAKLGPDGVDVLAVAWPTSISVMSPLRWISPPSVQPTPPLPPKGPSSITDLSSVWFDMISNYYEI